MHPHIPKQEAAQFLPRQRDAAHKSVNKEQFRVARHKLRRRTKAEAACREGYFHPPTEHSGFCFFSQQSSDLVDAFAWNRTACLEGRKSMKAFVIKAKLLRISEGEEV